MMNNLSVNLYRYLADFNPWTNAYGLARSIMASAMLLTLLSNDIYTFYPIEKINRGGISGFSFFTLPGIFEYLVYFKLLAIIILLLVIIGWRPQLTCWFHWWLAFSFQSTAFTVDGGEQVAAVFTLLLIPVAMTDPRKNHWHNTFDQDLRKGSFYYKSITLVIMWSIRIQVAFLYLNSVIAKIKNVDWINGTSVYYYLNDYMLGLPDILHEMFDFVLESSLVVVPTFSRTTLSFSRKTSVNLSELPF